MIPVAAVVLGVVVRAAVLAAQTLEEVLEVGAGRVVGGGVAEGGAALESLTTAQVTEPLQTSAVLGEEDLAVQEEEEEEEEEEEDLAVQEEEDLEVQEEEEDLVEEVLVAEVSNCAMVTGALMICFH